MSRKSRQDRYRARLRAERAEFVQLREDAELFEAQFGLSIGVVVREFHRPRKRPAALFAAVLPPPGPRDPWDEDGGDDEGCLSETRSQF